MGTKMRWRRRVGSGAVVVAALAVVAVALTGCTTTVTPGAAVDDPVGVYVLDHGHTPSLLVPTPDGGAVRYAYGDWDYYAMNRRHPLWNGLPALLWPTLAGMGRQDLERMPSPEHQDVVRAAQIPVDQVYVVTVERNEAEAFHRRIEADFRQRWQEHHYNPAAGLTFVPHPHSYTLAHDSNRAVRNWLEEMGAQTRGPFWAINWRITE